MVAATKEGVVVASVLDGLPADCKRKLEGFARAIDKAKSKSMASIMELGKLLTDSQDELANHGDGLFCKWIAERCMMSKASAYNYINAFAAFGDKDCPTIGQTFDASAIYYLAKDTTPEDAIEKAIEQAEAGERITLKKAKDIVAKCSEPPKERLDETDEPEDAPIPTGLRPYESLHDAIDAMDAALAAIYLRWPSEYMHLFAERLAAKAEELQEKGTLVC